MQEIQVPSLGQEDPLEEEMATQSSVLAWRIPWTEEPGGLWSTGSQKVGHDRATDSACTNAHTPSKHHRMTKLVAGCLCLNLEGPYPPHPPITPPLPQGIMPCPVLSLSREGRK